MGRLAVITTRQHTLIKKWYEKEFLSVREIADRLLVSMAAVYRFMRVNGLPRRDFRTLNQLRFARKSLSYRLKHRLSLRDEKLKIAAIFLYWAEGTKRGQTVDFVNSEVAMCKIFMRFLREICRVDESRLRGYLYCHENQNPKQLIAFWSRTLRLPKQQFTKPFVRRRTKGEQKKSHHPQRMRYGVLHIRYSDVKLFQQIRQWVQEYATMSEGKKTGR